MDWEFITNRTEFPLYSTPEPDFDLDITNRTCYDEDTGGIMPFNDGSNTGRSQSNAEPSYFPFPDEPAAHQPKPPAPKGTQGKDYHCRSFCVAGTPLRTPRYRALQKVSLDKFDKTKKYDEQVEGAKIEYLREALSSFPFLEEYESAWPAVEFAKMYLKNTSDKARADAKKGAN
ncbi:hypothetical protein NMY22_g8741 [Coprinellus aureogranulatus]|nr:hypothetical protein NMY22_g8741 [Coprinellus aureogranulatus]